MELVKEGVTPPTFLTLLSSCLPAPRDYGHNVSGTHVWRDLVGVVMCGCRWAWSNPLDRKTCVLCCGNSEVILVTLQCLRMKLLNFIYNRNSLKFEVSHVFQTKYCC